MEVEISVVWLVGIIVLAVVAGYFIGRKECKLFAEEEMETINECTENVSDRHKKNGQRIFLGKIIASPVDGEVHYFYEGGRKGAVIVPKQGRVYAPISGKIIKLYPMGNAFLIRGDNQTEILIRVGRQSPDELCSMYFRARIVQNEIVNKGKLLLEFDKESLLAAGEDVNVTVSLESGMEEKEIVVTEKETVKVGDELLRIE